MGPDHAQLATNLNNLAAAQTSQGKFGEAVTLQIEVMRELGKQGLPPAALAQFDAHLVAYRKRLPVRDPDGS